jgi:hypothetical protein
MEPTRIFRVAHLAGMANIFTPLKIFLEQIESEVGLYDRELKAKKQKKMQAIRSLLIQSGAK